MAKKRLQSRPFLACIYAIPIGILGGLMGLGSAEFRLPVLVGLLGYTAKQAVPLNLTVLSYNYILLSLIFGAAITAFLGTGLAGFGLDIKTAGSGSPFVSLPTVLIGIIRYYHQGAFSDATLFQETIIPMGIGSILGAIIGGILVGIIPQSWLKLILGYILIYSAIRVFSHQKHKR